MAPESNSQQHTATFAHNNRLSLSVAHMCELGNSCELKTEFFLLIIDFQTTQRNTRMPAIISNGVFSGVVFEVELARDNKAKKHVQDLIHSNGGKFSFTISRKV